MKTLMKMMEKDKKKKELSTCKPVMKQTEDWAGQGGRYWSTVASQALQLLPDAITNTGNNYWKYVTYRSSVRTFKLGYYLVIFCPSVNHTLLNCILKEFFVIRTKGQPFMVVVTWVRKNVHIQKTYFKEQKFMFYIIHKKLNYFLE